MTRHVNYLLCRGIDIHQLIAKQAGHEVVFIVFVNRRIHKNSSLTLAICFYCFFFVLL